MAKDRWHFLGLVAGTVTVSVFDKYGPSASEAGYIAWAIVAGLWVFWCLHSPFGQKWVLLARWNKHLWGRRPEISERESQPSELSTDTAQGLVEEERRRIARDEYDALDESARLALRYIMIQPVTEPALREHVIAKGLPWSTQIPSRLERVLVTHDFSGRLSILPQYQEATRELLFPSGAPSVLILTPLVLDERRKEIERYREMVRTVHKQSLMAKNANRTITSLLEVNPDFLAFKPYLSKKSMDAVYGRMILLPPPQSTMAGALHSILFDIEELEKVWGLRSL